MKTTDEFRKKYFGVILLFSVLSASLIWAAWYASGITPSLMTRNYRSVQYAAEMEGALVAAYLEAVHGKEFPPAEVKRFDKNLVLAKENITEVNEDRVLTLISEEWAAFIKTPVTPNVNSFQKVFAGIGELTALNEEAMHEFEKTAQMLRYTVLSCAGVGFFLVLVYSIEIVIKD